MFGLWFGIAAGYHVLFGYPRGHVTRKDVGAAWPLTVGDAVLHCRSGDVLTVSLLSKDQTNREQTEFELTTDPPPDDPIHDIWRQPKSLRPLLVRARELCDG